MTTLLDATAAQFQASWYFTLLSLVVILVICLSIAVSLGSARRMWQSNERAFAVLVVAVSAVTAALFAAMTVTAVVGLFFYSHR